MGLFTRNRPRALTASATRISGPENSYAKRLRQPRQLRALDYYDLIGELHYACQFIARQLSRVRFFPARLDENGKLEEITTGPPVELLDRIQDPAGGRSSLQYDYGRLKMITGEGILFGYRLETEFPRWKFLWNDEVKFLDGGVAVRLTTEMRETNEVGVGYRMWTPHPRHSDLADSPVLAALQICEELVRLTDSVMATAVTRLTNGVLVMPLEGIPQALTGGQDEDPERNPFLQDFTEHITNQIDQPASASAKVPFLYTPPYEYADRFSWVKTHDPATDYMEKDLRDEAIKRLALAMDMPPEALLGMTDANHWTAKQVMHDMWRSHGVVQAEYFADDLASAYLKPALEFEEYPGWEAVVVGYDDSMVVISPDRTEDADKALDRVAISRVAYRELKGFPEDYAPDDDEEKFLTALRMRNPELAAEELGFELTPQRGPLPSGNGNAPAEEGPPAPSQGRPVSRQEARTASVLGAAALALRQCRAKAGARLRSHQQSCDECKEKTDGLPHSLVASTLGQVQVEEFGLKAADLVKGGTDELQVMLTEEIGLDPVQAAALCQRVEKLAEATLFERDLPYQPPGFTAQVIQAMEASDDVGADQTA